MSYPKDGRLESPAFLGWARRQSCFGCEMADEVNHVPRRFVPAEPHHHPSKGASGVTRDDLVVPLCRECHDRAHRLDRYSREWQDHAVHVARSRFLETAHPGELRLYFADLLRFRDRPLAVPY